MALAAGTKCTSSRTRAGGTRLLLLRPAESSDKPVTVMHVVLNWTEELKRLVPAK